MAKYQPEWKLHPGGSVWIAHATVGEQHLERLETVEKLTVWAVRFPAGFLARLPKLWWLDMRGGTATDLSILEGCQALRGLVVNQVRGLRDLDAVSDLTTLEVISLYGLAQLESLPRFDRLTRLTKLELGQLRSLRDWDSLLETPALRELVLVNKVSPDDRTVAALHEHPSLETFDWWAPDESQRRVQEVTDRIGRAPAEHARPGEWLGLRYPPPLTPEETRELVRSLQQKQSADDRGLQHGSESRE